MGVKAINSKKEFDEIKATGKTFLVDFWATWCGPCRTIAPEVEKMTSDFAGVEFYKVDVDEQEEISAEYEIRAMPTFILFKNGKIEEKFVGANPKGLRDLLEQKAV